MTLEYHHTIFFQGYKIIFTIKLFVYSSSYFQMHTNKCGIFHIGKVINVKPLVLFLLYNIDIVNVS